MTISIPTAVELVTTNVTDSNTELLYKTVACGQDSSYYIDVYDSYKLYSTGSNDAGELGLGDYTDRSSYTYTGIDNVKSVHAGSSFVLILKYDGTVWGAGANNSGQLGLGGAISSINTFSKVGIDNVHSIFTSAVSISTFIVKKDGSLWATGDNTYGQLGLGVATASISTFTDTGYTDVVDVSSGRNHTIIKLNNGSFYAAGDNTNYQLLNGTATASTSFIYVTSVSSAKKIICGVGNSHVIKYDDTLWAIGLNTYGQLGVGDTVDKTALTDTGETNVSNISCGSNSTSILTQHTRIIKTNGSVWATGYNVLGNLGVGDNTNRSSYTDTTETAIGIQSYAIVDTSFNLLTTGDNLSGQAGLGDTTSRNSFIDTGKNTNYYEFFDEFSDGDIIQFNNNLYSVSNITYSPSIFYNLSLVSVSNPYKPFNGYNYSTSTSTTTMTYTVKGTEAFDTLALGRLKADSATIVFKDSLGTTIDSYSRTIDTSRDSVGNVGRWYTTEIFYASQVMEINSTVEITLTIASGETIELGTIMLGMSMEAGMSNLSMTHSYKDFSIAQYDVWGNLDYVERQRINTYKGNVSVEITNYDKTIRLMTSLGKQLVIVNGSTVKNETPDSYTVFSATQMIGRFMSFSTNTMIKEDALDQLAKYDFTLEELA